MNAAKTWRRLGSLRRSDGTGTAVRCHRMGKAPRTARAECSLTHYMYLPPVAIAQIQRMTTTSTTTAMTERIKALHNEMDRVHIYP